MSTPHVARAIDMSQYALGDLVAFMFNYAAEQTPVIVAMRRTSAKVLNGALWPKLEQYAKSKEYSASSEGSAKATRIKDSIT